MLCLKHHMDDDFINVWVHVRDPHAHV